MNNSLEQWLFVTATGTSVLCHFYKANNNELQPIDLEKSHVPLTVTTNDHNLVTLCQCEQVL